MQHENGTGSAWLPPAVTREAPARMVEALAVPATETMVPVAVRRVVRVAVTNADTRRRKWGDVTTVASPHYLYI